MDKVSLPVSGVGTINLILPPKPRLIHMATILHILPDQHLSTTADFGPIPFNIMKIDRITDHTLECRKFSARLKHVMTTHVQHHAEMAGIKTNMQIF